MKKHFLLFIFALLTAGGYAQDAGALITSAKNYNDSQIVNNTTRQVTPKKVHDAIDNVIKVLIHFNENWSPGVSKDTIVGLSPIIIDSLSAHKYRVSLDTTGLLSQTWRTNSANATGSVLDVADKSFTASIGGASVLEINKYNSSNRSNSIYLGYGQNAYGKAAIGIGAYAASADSCIALGYTSLAAGTNSISIGNRVNTAKDYTISLGNDIYGPADDSGTDLLKDSTLYISRYVKHFHLKLDSATGSAPNVVGVGPDGYWHRYAVPSGGGSDNLADVTGRGASTATPISVTGSGFSETILGGDYISIARPAGQYAVIRADSLKSAQTLQLPDTSGTLYVKPYKEYVAILNQSGTDAPVATVLQNELGTVTWSRESAGSYSAYWPGFTPGKTIVQITTGEVPGDTYVLSAACFTSGEVLINSVNSFSQYWEDNLVNSAQIIIRVYP